MQIRKDVKRDAEAKISKKPKANKVTVTKLLPAQMELPQPGPTDASLEAAMAGDILPMREFITTNPDRVNDLATAVIAQRPDLVGQLKYVAGELDYKYIDGSSQKIKKADGPAEEDAVPAQRHKLQVKAKPPAPTTPGPIIKTKKNRAVAVPPDGDLPAGMEFPE